MRKDRNSSTRIFLQKSVRFLNTRAFSLSVTQYEQKPLKGKNLTVGAKEEQMGKFLTAVRDAGKEKEGRDLLCAQQAKALIIWKLSWDGH